MNVSNPSILNSISRYGWSLAPGTLTENLILAATVGSAYLIGTPALIGGTAVYCIQKMKLFESRRDPSLDTPVQSKLLHIVPIVGTVLGCAAGAMASLAKTGSLNHRSLGDCIAFNQLSTVGSMNAWRESHFRGYLLPMAPVAQLVPASLFAVYNGFQKNGVEARTCFGILYKMGDNMWSMTVSPTLNNMSSAILAGVIRKYAKDPAENNFNIDISGHACWHLIYLFHTMNFLQTLTDRGSSVQVKVASLALGALALTEIPWAFNTTANCHSVADVVTGAAIATLSHITINKCVFPLIRWGGKKIKNGTIAAMGYTYSSIKGGCR